MLLLFDFTVRVRRSAAAAGCIHARRYRPHSPIIASFAKKAMLWPDWVQVANTFGGKGHRCFRNDPVTDSICPQCHFMVRKADQSGAAGIPLERSGKVRESRHDFEPHALLATSSMLPDPIARPSYPSLAYAGLESSPASSCPRSIRRHWIKVHCEVPICEAVCETSYGPEEVAESSAWSSIPKNGFVDCARSPAQSAFLQRVINMLARTRTRASASASAQADRNLL